MEGRKVDMFKNLRQILNENATDSYYNINCIKSNHKGSLTNSSNQKLVLFPSSVLFSDGFFFLWKRGGDFMNK